MERQKITLGGKAVQQACCYEAKQPPMVGRRLELNMILASWMSGKQTIPLSPLLTGEPGVGKNRLVYECARLCNKELYIFQGHEDVTAEDVACTARFSDDPVRKIDYLLSPLATAMLRGGICFIDEIAKMRPRALALLVSVLDERRYLDSCLLGERIQAHPGFRFIAATNSADIEVNLLPEYIRSRMRPLIHVSMPERREIDKIIKRAYPRISGKSQDILDLFWRLWRRKKSSKTPSPRDALYLFGLTLNITDYESIDDIGNLDLNTSKASPDSKHLRKAFDQLFNCLEREKYDE